MTTPTDTEIEQGVSTDEDPPAPRNLRRALLAVIAVAALTISVAAGTYTTKNVGFDTPSRKQVLIHGPNVGGSPNVPTAVVDGTGSANSDFGLRAVGEGVQVNWQDLKFQNYAGGTLSIGLLADYGADLWTNNVHAANCTGQGIYGEGCRIVRIAGGVIDGARQGILLNACGQVQVGYPLLPTDPKPKYAVVVMVEGGTSGGGDCAPVAGDIYRAIVQWEKKAAAPKPLAARN